MNFFSKSFISKNHPNKKHTIKDIYIQTSEHIMMLVIYINIQSFFRFRYNDGLF